MNYNLGASKKTAINQFIASIQFKTPDETNGDHINKTKMSLDKTISTATPSKEA